MGTCAIILALNAKSVHSQTYSLSEFYILLSNQIKESALLNENVANFSFKSKKNVYLLGGTTYRCNATISGLV